MAREKNITKIAKTSNQDLKATLAYDGRGPGAQLFVTIVIEHDQGEVHDVARFPVSSALTGSIGAGTEQSRFNQLMLVLRDYGFDLEGYNEV